MEYHNYLLQHSEDFGSLWCWICRKNNIGALQSDIFFNLTKLEGINLWGNLLHTIPNKSFDLEALEAISFVFHGRISEISKIRFHKSNLRSFVFMVFLRSNINNATFENFASLPLQRFMFYAVSLAGHMSRALWHSVLKYSKYIHLHRSFLPNLSILAWLLTFEDQNVILIILLKFDPNQRMLKNLTSYTNFLTTNFRSMISI